MFHFSDSLFIRTLLQRFLPAVAGREAGLSIGGGVWVENSNIEIGSFEPACLPRSHLQQCLGVHHPGHWMKHQWVIHLWLVVILAQYKHHCILLLKGWRSGLWSRYVLLRETHLWYRRAHVRSWCESHHLCHDSRAVEYSNCSWPWSSRWQGLKCILPHASTPIVWYRFANPLYVMMGSAMPNFLYPA